MLNRNLNGLKKVFDRIESYEPSLNAGLRSLKNIGVWLCVYALTDEKDQTKLIRELADKAALKDEADIVMVRKLVDELVKPDVLAQVIADYEAANGSFTLSVNTEANLQKLQSKIVERNYQNILSRHVKFDPSQDAALIFLMKNEIKFNWAASGADYNLTPGEFRKVKDAFQGEMTDFLLADSDKHQVEYGLFEHNKRQFHVVRLGTLQKDGEKDAKRTNAWIIESVDGADTASLQKDYFEIIEAAKQQGFNAPKTYEQLQDSKFKQLNNVSVRGEPEGYDVYRFIVRFPQIAAPIKTTEERLGIYAHYQGKVIANIFADNVKYKGVRELTYDHKGGEIKNREEFGVFECAMARGPNYINIFYTAANPFMMVYEAVNGADYYPYFISDPRKNLELSFAASKSYPAQQRTPGFASQGQSLFTLPARVPCAESDNMDIAIYRPGQGGK